MNDNPAAIERPTAYPTAAESPKVVGQTPTMDDVARSASVSRATVSRVLAGTARVSDSTQDRVLRAIKDLGYVPNRMAQSLATRSSGLVGLLLRDPRKAAYGLLHSELQQVSDRENLQLITVVPSSSEASSAEKRALQRLLGLRVDGLFVATGVIGPEDLAPFLSVVPVVSVGRPEAHDGVYGVSYDEVAHGQMAADLLLRHGHRDIAVLATASSVSVPESMRAEAIMARLLERGATVHPVRATTFGIGAEHSHRIADMVREGTITAVAFPTDDRALDFLTIARKSGLQVPADVSVIGMDGISPAMGMIGLATVRIPIEAVADRAVTVMGDLLEHRESLPIRHERFRGHVVDGATLGPLPRKRS
ncbi:LacI family transcriptional regulator [Brachybacterium muris]|uniref:LacI family DNA-binding transcriptional regulator n=1 Tax=Brachybacterium muris TaxID=219301 RepID=UPI00223B5F5C|nr:LacI family transcriptional regulator [Brachybacterium muris]